jgi:isopentenyl diphosphate isomerase/L-lactate dehydrogenase-like FMN-dependent dehydrogenase
MRPAYNIHDLRAQARARLPRLVFEFIDRGTEDEVTWRHNYAAFERIKLAPRTLVDVSRRSQKIELFGKRFDLPLAIAPTGSAGLLWYQGEIGLARAAAAAGIPFTLATNSLTAMEEVKAHAGGTLWFQLYLWRDRKLSEALVQRAHAAGYEALMVTVDSVVPANREHNQRNGFTKPFTFSPRNVTDVMMHPTWFITVLARYLLTVGLPKFENYPAELKAQVAKHATARPKLKSESLTWDDLRALRKFWPHALIVKGILTAQDAKLAADCGADGIVVSNHGGRNLDGAVTPLEVLPEIVDVVGQRLAVLTDSGYRRGSDVVKALALGAKAVLLGKSMLYGVAAGGEAGAARALALFREEIDRVMALIGCASVEQLTRDYLHVLPPLARPVVHRADVSADKRVA